MKGRSGSTGVETAHVVPKELKHAENGEGRQSLSDGASLFQRQLRPARLAVSVAGLAIVFLLSVLFVSYGSRLYQNWREHRLLDRATALLQEGKLSKAAQM